MCHQATNKLMQKKQLQGMKTEVNLFSNNPQKKLFLISFAGHAAHPAIVEFTILVSYLEVGKSSQNVQWLHLTHWGLVTPYGVGDLGQHWCR